MHHEAFVRPIHYNLEETNEEDEEDNKFKYPAIYHPYGEWKKPEEPAAEEEPAPEEPKPKWKYPAIYHPHEEWPPK